MSNRRKMEVFLRSMVNIIHDQLLFGNDRILGESAIVLTLMNVMIETTLDFRQ